MYMAPVQCNWVSCREAERRREGRWWEGHLLVRYSVSDRGGLLSRRHFLDYKASTHKRTVVKAQRQKKLHFHLIAVLLQTVMWGSMRGGEEGIAKYSRVNCLFVRGLLQSSNVFVLVVCRKFAQWMWRFSSAVDDWAGPSRQSVPLSQHPLYMQRFIH